jgi:F-type H+-transporting ATPase subunit b
MIVLFIMIYALNKLLFQPVLRTLDNRTDAIAKSEQSVIQVSEEVESLKQDFQKQLDALRTEALHLKNTGHEEGLAERESMILEERQTLENEIEKSISELEGEINSTKKIFSKLNKELSASIRKQFIN